MQTEDTESAFSEIPKVETRVTRGITFRLCIIIISPGDWILAERTVLHSGEFH